MPAHSHVHTNSIQYDKTMVRFVLISLKEEIQPFHINNTHRVRNSKEIEFNIFDSLHLEHDSDHDSNSQSVVRS